MKLCVHNIFSLSCSCESKNILSVSRSSKYIFTLEKFKNGKHFLPFNQILAKDCCCSRGFKTVAGWFWGLQQGRVSKAINISQSTTAFQPWLKLVGIREELKAEIWKGPIEGIRLGWLFRHSPTFARQLERKCNLMLRSDWRPRKCFS